MPLGTRSEQRTRSTESRPMRFRRSKPQQRQVPGPDAGSRSLRLHDPQYGRSFWPLLEGKEDMVRRRIDRHGMARVAGVHVADRCEAGLLQIEDDEISALRSDIDPAEAW